MTSMFEYSMITQRGVTISSTRIALLLAACISFSACQSYTTGLQQTANSADETAAIAAMNAIRVAQRTYSVSNGGDFGTFQQLTQASYLDSRFNSSQPQVRGYVFAMTVGDKSFSCNADPTAQGAQPFRHFFIDSTSTEIHVNPTQPATAADAGLQ